MRLLIATAVLTLSASWSSFSLAAQAPNAAASGPSSGAPGHAGTRAPEHPGTRAPVQLPPFIPPLTDADRAAARSNVQVHGMKDDAINYFVLFDQLEGLAGSHAGASWDTRGWIGKDRDRFSFRTEGTGEGGHLDDASAHALYGRAISRWWDLIAGVRQDFEPGPAQTWAAVGVQGLAPYWFDVQATAYVGASWRTHFRIETEYELLLTNRLVFQPLVELEFCGREDPERGYGTGLSTGDLGLRLRYEIRREIAPYVGVAWHRKYFGTADYAAAAGESTGGVRAVFGIRAWM